MVFILCVVWCFFSVFYIQSMQELTLGLFSNKLNTYIEIYRNGTLYKTMCPFEEIPLPMQEFKIGIPFEGIAEIQAKAFFYAYIYSNENNANNIMVIEELQGGINNLVSQNQEKVYMACTQSQKKILNAKLALIRSLNDIKYV